MTITNGIQTEVDNPRELAALRFSMFYGGSLERNLRTLEKDGIDDEQAQKLADELKEAGDRKLRR